MIESIDNALQLAVTGILAAVSTRRAVISGKRVYSLLSLFYLAYFLGSLYWQLYLVFYHMTPLYSLIPYISWYTSYLFLLLILVVTGSKKGEGRNFRVLWAVPAFTGGMCVFYMQWGAYLSNIISFVLMTVLIWKSLKNLLLIKDGIFEYAGNRCFFVVTLVFCFLEYTLWTSSCFWQGNSIRNPYFWFDTMLTFSFLLFLPAAGKAVET